MFTDLNISAAGVSYERLVSDIASEVVRRLALMRSDPEYISQRKAYSMFGRGNVDRWRRQGKIQPCKRPGKIEYRTAELRMLQSTIQDYFE